MSPLFLLLGMIFTQKGIYAILKVTGEENRRLLAVKRIDARLEQEGVVTEAEVSALTELSHVVLPKNTYQNDHPSVWEWMKFKIGL